MDEIKQRVKQAYEDRLGREASDEEVEECYLWFRQLAVLVQEWARDEALCGRLGIRPPAVPPERAGEEVAQAYAVQPAAARGGAHDAS